MGEAAARLAHGPCAYHIAVTGDPAVRPNPDLALTYESAALVPVTPFRIDGHGSNGHHQPSGSVEVTMSRTKVPPTKDGGALDRHSQ